MINTLSICPTCYKKIPAKLYGQNGAVWMAKECSQHGHFSALVEKDQSFFTAFYREGTLGKNKSIIIHTYDKCNLNCSWCYYKMGEEEILSPEEINQVLGQYRGWNLMLSGGEPTIDPRFFRKVSKLHSLGWSLSCITNMTQLANKDFLAQAMDSPLHVGNTLAFACSYQHPKNHPEWAANAKIEALINMERAGVQPSCIMFSIQDLGELEYIKAFYDKTRGCYPMLRIRTMFRNWGANGIKKEIFLSDLYKKFCKVFGDELPQQSFDYEHSNLYCLYLKTPDCTISLSSGPSVDDVDYHQCSRPVFMLARDKRCYPVPLAQIINEGISNGWKDGLKLASKGV